MDISSHQDFLDKKNELIKEIEEYNRERDQIKQYLGKIGGRQFSRVDLIINITFLAIILTLFVLEITTKFLPSYISIEIGVLLVSVKIVWMIHSQHKVNHFQFWVLNTIEFRINDMAKRLKKIEKSLAETD